VTSAAVGWQLSQALGDTPEGIWLHAHLAEFGFALSYPPGEEETTGYIYEPWHLRYVGTACAAEWEASGLTLIEVLRGDHLGGVGPSTRS
jgi:D-alanyl-D-alanine carboxypeptidase